MLLTLFAFQIVLTSKRMHHIEFTTLALSLQKFPRTVMKSGKYLHSTILLDSLAFRFRGQLLNQHRHRVFRQMVEELAHGVDSLPARRAPWHDHTFPALRD